MHPSFASRAGLFASILTLSAFAAGCVAEIDDADALGEPATGEAADALWGDHVTKAQQYVNDILPANNNYGSPAKLEYDSNSVLYATVECGSFTSMLMRNTYSTVTTTVLQDLTGSVSPDASQWYDGIKPISGTRPSSSGISLIPLDNAAASPTGRTMSYLAVGDILAAKYTLGDSSGHVMTVGAITAPPANEQRSLTGTKVIPNVTYVKRWLVKIYDSTSSVHGKSADYPDSRYGKEPTASDKNDRGIGSGYLYLYEDATANSATLGQLVGWSWSTQSANTFQFTDTTAVDDADKTTYRPMVIGRFSGL